jgi:hypothetical protein
MNPDEVKFRESLPKTIRRFRQFGWLFLVTTLAFASFISYTAFDPSVPFHVNGVETRDVGERLRASAFVWFLPVFGAFFALTPRAMLEGLLLYQFGEIVKMRRRFRFDR